MRDLDDTDVEILRLLADDARRSFASIGDEVGLSGPAVSDRVSRLEEVGVLRRFTVDVDRSQLREGTPVLARLELPPVPPTRSPPRCGPRTPSSTCSRPPTAT